MKNALKFLDLCETVLTRTQQQGFVYNDVVDVDLNGVPAHLRDELEALRSQGLNLKVVDIISTAEGTTLLIGASHGGGRIVGKVPVPSTSCKVVDSSPNLETIPDALRRDNVITIKPEPVPGYDDEFTNQTNKTDQGDGKLSPTEDSLAQSNISIPSPTPPNGQHKGIHEAYKSIYK
jgi:hypothetical protein